MSTTPVSSPGRASPDPNDEALHNLEDLLGEKMPPIVRQTRDMFRRELSTLLQEHPGRWIAYGAVGRLMIGNTKTELYQECLRRGLKRDEFLVLRIEREGSREIDVPVDV
jgi:hypothetical protein